MDKNKKSIESSMSYVNSQQKYSKFIDGRSHFQRFILIENDLIKRKYPNKSELYSYPIHTEAKLDFLNETS